MARSDTDKYFKQLVDFIIHGGDRNGSFFLNACKQYDLEASAVLRFADRVLSLKYENNTKSKKDAL